MSQALAVALAVAGLGVFAPAAAAATPRFHDADGIHVISARALDSRLIALTVSTPAIGAPANVRILLPSGYSRHRGRHYPVLYLLHGTSGTAANWTTMGGAEQTTAGRPLIVVMPDIAHDAEAQLLITPIINATETFLDHVMANSMFGPRLTEEVNWAAHDPPRSRSTSAG